MKSAPRADTPLPTGFHTLRGQPVAALNLGRTRADIARVFEGVVLKPELLDQILALLPQQRPFRYVDEILEVDEQRIVGRYTFREDEWFYAGHFPGRPVTPGVIWTGSDDGLVHVTRDGGATWKNVTPPGAPDFLRINTIEASPTAPGKAYVAGIRYLVENDRRPYVWRTEDYGQTWTLITGGIPTDDFVRAVREDPERAGLLYAASERTVYISWNDGARWQPLTWTTMAITIFSSPLAAATASPGRATMAWAFSR